MKSQYIFFFFNGAIIIKFKVLKKYQVNIAIIYHTVIKLVSFRMYFITKNNILPVEIVHKITIKYKTKQGVFNTHHLHVYAIYLSPLSIYTFESSTWINAVIYAMDTQ